MWHSLNYLDPCRALCVLVWVMSYAFKLRSFSSPDADSSFITSAVVLVICNRHLKPLEGKYPKWLWQMPRNYASWTNCINSSKHSCENNGDTSIHSRLVVQLNNQRRVDFRQFSTCMEHIHPWFYIKRLLIDIHDMVYCLLWQDLLFADLREVRLSRSNVFCHLSHMSRVRIHLRKIFMNELTLYCITLCCMWQFPSELH